MPCAHPWTHGTVCHATSLSSLPADVLQTALKEGAPELAFMGKQVQVNPAAGLFVTLNPAGKGYGGRSKLPDNLKQMFRWADPLRTAHQLVLSAM